MQRFLRTQLALLHKEWRDVRALTIACALLVPGGLLAIEYGYLDWRGDIAAATYVPVCIGLFLAVISADIIAADIATKRARAFAALPTRWSSLWASKLTFLLLIGAAFSVWTVTSCAAIYATLAPAEANTQFLVELSRLPPMAVYATLFAVATVVFWSTVLERGFAVVGAAVVTCTAIGGTIPLLHWISPELVPDDEAVATALLALPPVFLAGSLLAFVRAPQHTSSVWRRLAIAAIIPIVVLLPAGAISAAVLSQRLDVEPHDPGLRLALGHVSPDGRRLVILAAKPHKFASLRTWILDLEDGSLAQLGELNLSADQSNPWADDGAYRAWTPGDTSTASLYRLYDQETGVVLETRSAKQVNSGRLYPFVDWATTRIEGADMIVTLSATGVECALPVSRSPQFSRLPGYALYTDTAGVHLHDLVAGTSRIIRAPERARERFINATFSPTGAYVRMYSPTGSTIVDVQTGSVVDDGSHGIPWFPGGGSDDRFVFRDDDGERVILDLATQATYASVQAWTGNPFLGARVLPDRRVIQLTIDGRIEIQNLDGTNPRTVYAPKQEN